MACINKISKVGDMSCEDMSKRIADIDDKISGIQTNIIEFCKHQNYDGAYNQVLECDHLNEVKSMLVAIRKIKFETKLE